MKAMRIHAWGEPPRLDELPEPAPRPGRSLVRMAATSVSHLDRSIAAGGFLRHPPLPYVPGVEAAGTVLQSERFAVGARVWLRGAGLGTGEDGTWCETISAPDAAIGLLPDAIAMPLGAAFFSPCTAAWVALFSVGALQAGERVLISGATGAVGSIALQLARDPRSRCHRGAPPRRRHEPSATAIERVRIDDWRRDIPRSISSSMRSAGRHSPACSRASCRAAAPCSSATPRASASSSTSPS